MNILNQMKRVFFKTAARSGVMEPESISKNGASPKSRMSRGNLIASAIVMILCAFALHAQNTQTLAELRRGDALKEYLRPSLTTIFLDRGEAITQRLISQMVANGIPSKFDDNSVAHNALSVKGEVSVEYLRQVLEQQATKEIMRKWFPSFEQDKGWSLDVVHERGRYTATDADYIAAMASALKESLLKDIGLNMINRSYIVVYDFFDAQTVKTEKSEGYSTNCNVYLFHLDWDAVKSAFYDNWLNPKAIDELTFPVKFMASMIGKSNLTPVKITQSNSGDLWRLSDDDLFRSFTKEIEKVADVYLTEINEDFRVKAALFATSPIRAKIGTKEGVTVDQRYFVYERQLNAAGEEVAKRKGVIRATSNIAKNDTVATGEGGTTTFYQTYGSRLYEGMTIQQKVDWGVGVSLRGGTDISVLGEFNVAMWLGQLIPALQNTKVPYGSKMYVRLDYPLSPMEINGYQLSDSEGKAIHSWMFAFGVSKDFYFMRQLSLSPFLGITSLIKSSSTEGTIESVGKSTSNVEIGMNGSFAIVDNVQIVGSVSYNALKEGFFSAPLAFGVGLRYQF